MFPYSLSNVSECFYCSFEDLSKSHNNSVSKIHPCSAFFLSGKNQSYQRFTEEAAILG